MLIPRSFNSSVAKLYTAKKSVLQIISDPRKFELKKFFGYTVVTRFLKFFNLRASLLLVSFTVDIS